MKPNAGFPDFGPMADSKHVWVNHFDQEAVISFYEKFLELETNPSVNIIPIFINSYGGDLFALMSMRDLIKSSPKPVATIAVGMAMSCGASLLAAGTPGHRFASTDCQILIHQVSGGVLGKTADIVEAAEQYRFMNSKILDNLAKDTKTTRSQFEKQIRKKHNADWTMVPKEAKQWGIIDHIGIPRMVPVPPQSVLIVPPTYEKITLDRKKAAIRKK